MQSRSPALQPYAMYLINYMSSWSAVTNRLSSQLGGLDMELFGMRGVTTYILSVRF
jgi:hypothetical protein